MVTNQAYLFLIFMVNGIIIGLLFDFFRIARRVFYTSDVVTYIEDILFWILTGFTILYSIFIFNNGELRLYMLISVIIGAIIYMIFISSYIIKILIIPIKFFHTILQKTFLKPITFLFINIRKSTKNFVVKLKNIYKNCKKTNRKEGISKNM